jgi:hypothetical protein
MEAKDWITVVALIFGPLVAVVITLWHQNRTQKLQAKERLFLTLMAHRKSNPPTIDWANSLNLIDVVFAHNRAVVEKWHDAYNISLQRPWNQERWNRSYIELLSEMAKVLKFRRLQQTDIDRFYSPEAHGTEAAAQKEFRDEFLRVLKDTKSLHIAPKNSDKPAGDHS